MDKKDKTKERGTILQYNCCYGNSKDELIEQFNQAGSQSTRCKKPFTHVSISFSPRDSEKVNEELMQQITEKFSNYMGLNDHLWFSVIHNDSPGRCHYHLAICSINPTTKKAIKQNNNYQKMSEFSRQCELDFALETVLSPKKFLPKEKQNLPRRDSRRENLKTAIVSSLDGCTSIPQFEDRMKAIGYSVEKGRGIAFKDAASVRFKGSDVGYSFDEIKKQIINNLDFTNKYDIPKTLNLSL
jgi:hypothetical protein